MINTYTLQLVSVLWQQHCAIQGHLQVCLDYERYERLQIWKQNEKPV
jgi:hypothetical protein